MLPRWWYVAAFNTELSCSGWEPQFHSFDITTNSLLTSLFLLFYSLDCYCSLEKKPDTHLRSHPDMYAMCSVGTVHDAHKLSDSTDTFDKPIARRHVQLLEVWNPILVKRIQSLVCSPPIPHLKSASQVSLPSWEGCKSWSLTKWEVPLNIVWQGPINQYLFTSLLFPPETPQNKISPRCLDDGTICIPRFTNVTQFNSSAFPLQVWEPYNSLPDSTTTVI